MKANRNKGSVKEVLGLSKRNLKSLVSQRLEDYIRAVYSAPT